MLLILKYFLLLGDLWGLAGSTIKLDIPGILDGNQGAADFLTLVIRIN